MVKLIIPKELIFKIKTSLIITDKEAVLQFDDDEVELFEFCEKWFHILMTEFGYIKSDFGPYLGLFPLSLNKEKLKVYFNVDFIRPGNWKDWFVMDKDSPATHHFTYYTIKEEQS